jgi:hypothetical protein
MWNGISTVKNDEDHDKLNSQYEKKLYWAHSQ